MNIAKIIQLDLAARGAATQIGETAVAGDSGSGSLVFELMENGAAWNVPEGVRAALAFRTDGSCSGEYDTMPDGTDAFTIEGNRVTVRLIDQIMAASGVVRLALILRDRNLRQLSSFPVLLSVTSGIGGGAQLPTEFYRVRDLAQINVELARLDGLLKQLDLEVMLAAAQEAKAAAAEAKAAAASVNAELIAQAIDGKADDLYVEDGRLYPLSGGRILGEGVELPVGWPLTPGTWTRRTGCI
ncbi:MAG: hypothetical protein E7451_05715 [Ruminococcaceae bacterium]|nr:hypothetical protein [Oscillospiraceae bacterium]